MAAFRVIDQNSECTPARYSLEQIRFEPVYFCNGHRSMSICPYVADRSNLLVQHRGLTTSKPCSRCRLDSHRFRQPVALGCGRACARRCSALGSQLLCNRARFGRRRTIRRDSEPGDDKCSERRHGVRQALDNHLAANLRVNRPTCDNLCAGSTNCCGECWTPSPRVNSPNPCDFRA